MGLVRGRYSVLCTRYRSAKGGAKDDKDRGLGAIITK